MLNQVQHDELIIMWNSLGNLLPDSLRKAGIANNVSNALLCEEFQKIAQHILGKDIAEHCHAVYVKDGVMWIAVLSNAVSNELKMYEQDVLKALAVKFGTKRVTGLRFMT